MIRPRSSFARAPLAGVALLAVVVILWSGRSTGRVHAPDAVAEAQAVTVPGGGRVSPLLFGVNAPWHDLGNFTVVGGEMVRDRSFRLGGRFWRPVMSGAGSLEFSSTGGAPDEPDLHAPPGHARLTLTGSGLACAYHRLHDRIVPGDYTLEFSSRGERTQVPLLVLIVDSKYARVSTEAAETAAADDWKRHRATLRVTEMPPEADLAICVASPGTVLLDEVRLYRKDAAPTIDPAVKEVLRELGVRSLRWPGGTDVNSFDWTQAIGPLRSRGEQKLIYGGIQTPSFGLHEFLDLCEELAIQPLIVVNVLDTPASAAALVEYVLGDAATVQGRLRGRHGRNRPWASATYFQIGNEPTPEYGEPKQPGNAGQHYARRASDIADAMMSAARRSGRQLEIGVVAEGAMQLADWLTPGNTLPGMLQSWNAQVFGGRNHVLAATAATAHYYAYFDHSPDPRRQFENLMASGTVLRRTLQEKIRIHTERLPIWLTEYNVLIESKGTVQPSFTKDFQSGLVVGDILLTMLSEAVPAAHIHNLSESGAFGLIQRDGNDWYLRPAALVFQLFSAAAGERMIELAMAVRGVPDMYRIDRGAGNIPRGLTYQRIAGLATLNARTGRPRVFLLNRDYSSSASVTLAVPGHALAAASAAWYGHDSLAAHNDGRNHQSVSVRTEQLRGGSPWSITVPARTLVRIDFE